MQITASTCPNFAQQLKVQSEFTLCDTVKPNLMGDESGASVYKRATPRPPRKRLLRSPEQISYRIGCY